MRYLLWLQTGFVTAVTLLLLIHPATLQIDLTHADAKAVVRVLAFANLALAVLGIALLRMHGSIGAKLVGLVTLAAYHGGMALAQGANFFEQMGSLFPVIIHALFAAAFALQLRESLRHQRQHPHTPH